MLLLLLLLHLLELAEQLLGRLHAVLVLFRRLLWQILLRVHLGVDGLAGLSLLGLARLRLSLLLILRGLFILGRGEVLGVRLRLFRLDLLLGRWRLVQWTLHGRRARSNCRSLSSALARTEDDLINGAWASGVAQNDVVILRALQ